MIPQSVIPTESRLKRFLVWREDNKKTTTNDVFGEQQQQKLSTNILGHFNKVATATTKVVDPLDLLIINKRKNRHSIAVIPTPRQPQQPAPITQKIEIKRKPLPKDCPQFEFVSMKEKILVLDQEEKEQHQQRNRHSFPIVNHNKAFGDTYLLAEKMEIPLRRESKSYMDIPDIQSRLDRACRNERVMLLQKHYEQQRHKHLI